MLAYLTSSVGRRARAEQTKGRSTQVALAEHSNWLNHGDDDDDASSIQRRPTIRWKLRQQVAGRLL